MSNTESNRRENARRDRDLSERGTPIYNHDIDVRDRRLHRYDSIDNNDRIQNRSHIKDNRERDYVRSLTDTKSRPERRKREYSRSKSLSPPPLSPVMKVGNNRDQTRNHVINSPTIAEQLEKAKAKANMARVDSTNFSKHTEKDRTKSKSRSHKSGFKHKNKSSKHKSNSKSHNKISDEKYSDRNSESLYKNFFQKPQKPKIKIHLQCSPQHEKNNLLDGKFENFRSKRTISDVSRSVTIVNQSPKIKTRKSNNRSIN